MNVQNTQRGKTQKKLKKKCVLRGFFSGPTTQVVVIIRKILYVITMGAWKMLSKNISAYICLIRIKFHSCSYEIMSNWEGMSGTTTRTFATMFVSRYNRLIYFPEPVKPLGNYQPAMEGLTCNETTGPKICRQLGFTKLVIGSGGEQFYANP